MTIWIAWLVFPLVLGALSLGCGLLVERVAGIELPAALPARFRRSYRRSSRSSVATALLAPTVFSFAFSLRSVPRL
jgi:hypothetical protein